MKCNKIIITIDNIIGSEIKSKRIMNLSSIPAQLLKVVFTRFSYEMKGIKFLDLYNSSIFDAKTGKRKILIKTKTFVTFVVDSDDGTKDIKMRNIIKTCGVVAVSIIVLKAPAIRTNDDELPIGKAIRFAHCGHTKTIMNTLNANAMTTSNIQSLSVATVVRTGDRRCGSIAGILLCAEMYKIRIVKETQKIVYNESWIDTNKKQFAIFVDDRPVASDVIPSADIYWRYRTGYTDYIMTDQGVRRCCINNKIKETVWDKIKRIIKNTWTRLVNFIFNKTQKNKDVDNNKVKVAMTIFHVAPSLTCHLSSLIMSSTVKNASKDIKSANKIIAKMQINKMVSRSGLSGDKTMLANVFSPAFDAYIASTQSYNTTDAITTANNLAAAKYKTQRMMVNAILLIIIMIVAIITGNAIILIISTLIVIFDYFINLPNDTLLYYILACVCSFNLMSLVINLVALIAEYSIKDDKTKSMRAAMYFVALCISVLL